MLEKKTKVCQQEYIIRPACFQTHLCMNAFTKGTCTTLGARKPHDLRISQLNFFKYKKLYTHPPTYSQPQTKFSDPDTSVGAHPLNLPALPPTSPRPPRVDARHGPSAQEEMYGGSSVGSIRKATSEVAGPGCGRMRAKWRAYGESRIDSLI